MTWRFVKTLKAFCFVAMLPFFFFLRNILIRYPYFQRKFGRRLGMKHNAKMTFSWQMAKQCFNSTMIHFHKVAYFGGKAPDVKVFDLNGDEHNLLDFMKQDRPLVLNFGSCS
ncbi:unnamed protein product [Clavelina lepadiformis]|uniref:Iodothyronine deiodinase n=1 Tax=Clavelina lepadiformis TaxID=159417 RepID=A0ABP0EXG4_CLALP